MDAKTFAKVGFRILAVYLIVDGIVQIWDYLSLSLGWQTMPINTHMLLVFLFAIVSPLLAGIILWLLAPSLAGWAAGGVTEERLAVPLSAVALLNVGLIAIGIVFLCLALPNIFMMLYRAYEPGGYMNRLDTGYFIAEIVRGVLGILLVLGAKFFTRLIYRLRR